MRQDSMAGIYACCLCRRATLSFTTGVAHDLELESAKGKSSLVYQSVVLKRIV